MVEGMAAARSRYSMISALTALADVQPSKSVVNKAKMSPRMSFSDESGRAWTRSGRLSIQLHLVALVQVSSYSQS